MVEIAKTQSFLAPAEHVISYGTHVFDENFENKGPYMGSPIDGLPTDGTDALWEDLYQCRPLPVALHETKLTEYVIERRRQRN